MPRQMPHDGSTPTYLEAANIEEFLRRARAALPDADILVIDDNSPDHTADIAQKVADERGHIEVLRRPSKRGLGGAYRAGFSIGLNRNYDVLVQIDADLSHDPAVLPDGVPVDIICKMLVDNPLDTYPRLRESAGGTQTSRNEEIST